MVEVPDPVVTVDGLWVVPWAEVICIGLPWVAAICIGLRWVVPCTDPRCTTVPWAVWAAVTIAPIVIGAAVAVAVPCA